MIKTGTVFLLAAGLALGPLPARAGFGFDTKDQPIEISNQPNSPSWVPPEGAKSEGAKRPDSDPSAPALQIYEERYVPDSVKKKYSIKDDWYTIGNPEGVASVRPDAEPTPGPEPLIVNDGPGATSVPQQTSLAPDDMALPPEEQAAGAMAPAPVAQPVPVISAAAYAKLESWRARKGEPVREVIKRWSAREGTEMLWAAGDNPVLKKDFSYVGSMENAVAALIQANGTELYTQYRSDGMNPVMMSPASTVTTSAPAAPALETNAAPDKTVGGVPYNLFVPAPNKNLETRWFALSGASLQEVLQVWAEDEGAALVWQAHGNFALKDSVSQVGHFEDAVFQALSQYNSDDMRPVGQLYSDPASGRKVLLIKTETPS